MLREALEEQMEMEEPLPSLSSLAEPLLHLFVRVRVWERSSLYCMPRTFPAVGVGFPASSLEPSWKQDLAWQEGMGEAPAGAGLGKAGLCRPTAASARTARERPQRRLPRQLGCSGKGARAASCLAAAQAGATDGGKVLLRCPRRGCLGSARGGGEGGRRAEEAAGPSGGRRALGAPSGGQPPLQAPQEKLEGPTVEHRGVPGPGPRPVAVWQWL